ncbi:hypothetical protein HDU85_001343 [Gaertneriomyces sp. JEL0708]|nr:hypothetical protein HDU85_001343 [Gaertneriomyces sp. JEL0708]
MRKCELVGDIDCDFGCAPHFHPFIYDTGTPDYASKAFYATTYLMRVIMDAVALALFISWEERMSDTEEESIGLLDGNFHAGPFMYLMEVVRWPVAGMRIAQYADREQCGMSEDACTWRVGAWAGMLVFHITLSALLFIHVYHTRVRIGRKRAKMQEHLQTDAAPEMTPVIAERACSYYHFPNDIFPPRPIQSLATSTLPRNDGVTSATEGSRDEDDLPLATFLQANDNRRTTGFVEE